MTSWFGSLSPTTFYHITYRPNLSKKPAAKGGALPETTARVKTFVDENIRDENHVINLCHFRLDSETIYLSHSKSPRHSIVFVIPLRGRSFPICLRSKKAPSRPSDCELAPWLQKRGRCRLKHAKLSRHYSFSSSTAHTVAS